MGKNSSAGRAGMLVEMDLIGSLLLSEAGEATACSTWAIALRLSKGVR